MAVPRASAAPPGSGAARGRPGRGPAVSSLGGGDTKALLDGGHHAVVRVEELLRDHGPAAELLDREQRLRYRELVRARRALHHGPIALLREDPLGLRRVEELDEVRRLAAGVLRDRDRVLDQDRLRRDRVVDLLAGLLRRDRLVLVGQHHVALAAGEGREGVARALVLHGDVLEEEAEEGGGLGVGLALGDLAAVGRHHVPARAAARERVRRDHLDARLREVLPLRDVLGVALARHEDDDRVGDHALVLVLVPALVDEAAVHQPRDVGLERELDHVGLEAAVDRAALVAGGAVGLGERHVLALWGLLEGRDQRGVRLLGRRIRDEAQLVAAARAAAAAGEEGHERRGGEYGGQESGEGFSHLFVVRPYRLSRVWGRGCEARAPGGPASRSDERTSHSLLP